MRRLSPAERRSKSAVGSSPMRDDRVHLQTPAPGVLIAAGCRAGLRRGQAAGQDVRHAARQPFGHFLDQVGDSQASLMDHGPGIGFQFAGDDLEQRGFAHAVAPDEPQPLAGRSADRYLRTQRAAKPTLTSRILNKAMKGTSVPGGV